MRTGLVVIRKAGDSPMSFSEAKKAFREMRANRPEDAVSIELWSADGGMMQRHKYATAQNPTVPEHPDLSEPEVGSEPEAPMEPRKRHNRR